MNMKMFHNGLIEIPPRIMSGLRTHLTDLSDRLYYGKEKIYIISCIVFKPCSYSRLLLLLWLVRTELVDLTSMPSLKLTISFQTGRLLEFFRLACTYYNVTLCTCR